MHTKKMLFVISLFLISISKIYSQTDSSSYKNEFQFHIVNSYSLSYVNFISENAAIRYMLDINLNASGSDGDATSNSSSGSYTSAQTKSSSDSESNNQSIGFYPAYLIYPIRESIFTMYVGGGPFLSLQRYFSRYSSDTDNGNGIGHSTSSNLGYYLNLGIEGIIGVECSIAEKISLLAEYGLYAYYGWTKSKGTGSFSSETYTNNNTHESNGNRWGTGLSGVKLGIAFRF